LNTYCIEKIVNAQIMHCCAEEAVKAFLIVEVMHWCSRGLSLSLPDQQLPFYTV